MKLKLSTQAKTDIRLISGYIAQRSNSREIGRIFAEKLIAKCKELSSIKGQIGIARNELLKDLRSHPFGNYVIFFMYKNNAFEVITIIEGHRDINAMFD